jgi:hypothetical protein
MRPSICDGHSYGTLLLAAVLVVLSTAVNPPAVVCSAAAVLQKALCIVTLGSVYGLVGRLQHCFRKCQCNRQAWRATISD